MSGAGEADGRFDWLEELPLPIGRPDLQMGLRATTLDRWLPVDSLTPVELRHRARLLDTHTGLVMVDAGWDAAVDELLVMMERHLGRGIGSVDGRGGLDAAARAVPDDILLMADDGDGWRLVGGALVFPNQWTLAEKMGGTLTQIHAPVDGYDEILADRVDRFFDRFTPGRLVWRRNWFFHDTADFFQPERATPRRFDDVAGAAGLYVRSEWQTLRRLPDTGVIVFTVKTQIAPIAELAARADVAARMIGYLEAASPRALDNKDALGRERAIVSYLHRSLAERAPEMQDS